MIDLFLLSYTNLKILKTLWPIFDKTNQGKNINKKIETLSELYANAKNFIPKQADITTDKIYTDYFKELYKSEIEQH